MLTMGRGLRKEENLILEEQTFYGGLCEIIN
jgi:hypothetical protein